MGRYALITGASSGIGEAMARHLAAQGHDVGLCARRKEKLDALAQELQTTHGIKADVFAGDLAKPGSAARLLTKIAAKNRHVDILVNNAGLTVSQSFARTSLEHQLAFTELTIVTPTVLAHGLLPAMLETGYGRIMNVSSVMALSSGGQGHTLYPASKAYLLKFSQSLNAEVKDRGVHVSAVLPGVVKTDFQIANGMGDAHSVSGSPFAQTPEHVARAACQGCERGKEIIIPGLSAKLMAGFLRYTPEPLLRALTRPVAAKHYIGD